MYRLVFFLTFFYYVVSRNLSPNPYNEVTLVPITVRPLLEQASLWRVTGDAIVTDNGVLLTSQKSVINSQRGGLIGIQPLKYLGQHWQIDLTVRIYGDRFNLFGDGMALWLTRSPSLSPASLQEPHVLGGPVSWEGMGIFLDTFNNNAEQIGPTYPYISLLMNDRRLTVDRDPAAAVSPINLPAGCSAALRKTTDNIINENGAEPMFFTLRVEYNKADGNNLFTVSYLTSNNGQDYLGRQDWQTCFHTNNIFIPSGYYLSITSSTSDITSDNHIVHSILVHAEEGASEDMVPEDIRNEWAQHANTINSFTKSFQDVYTPIVPSPLPSPAENIENNINGENTNTNNPHAGDDPGAPPHQHEVENTPTTGTTNTEVPSDEIGAPPHEHEVAQQIPVSSTSTNPNDNIANAPPTNNNPVDVPSCPECRCETKECPPIDIDALRTVVKDHPMVQFVRTRVQSTASRLDGIQRNVGGKIEESNTRLESILQRMRETENNLEQRLAKVELELKEALEQLKLSSVSKSTQWLIPFIIIGCLVIVLSGAWFFNYRKVTKLHNY